MIVNNSVNNFVKCNNSNNYKRKLIMSVSRDVLESVEASQICFCNVDEDTVGWAQEAALSPGI